MLRSLLAVVLAPIVLPIIFGLVALWDWQRKRRERREHLRLTPQQWVAWDERAARVVDEQTRRGRVYLLPPPR